MIKLDDGHVVDTDKLFTADQLAPTLGASTYREWLHKGREKSRLARVVMKGKPINEKIQGDPVTAVVEHSRWVAHCECGGLENVTPDDPIFFCFSCLNADNQFHVRPVIFPSQTDQEAIEVLLMKRSKFEDKRWHQGKSILELETENKKLKKEGKK